MTILKKYFFIFGFILIEAPSATHAMLTGVETPYHPSPICEDHIDLSDPDNLWSILSHGIYRSNTIRSNVPKDLELIDQLTELAFHLQSNTEKSRKNKELLSNSIIEGQQISIDPCDDISSNTFYIQALTALCIQEIADENAPLYSLPQNISTQLKDTQLANAVLKALFFLLVQKTQDAPGENLISLLKQRNLTAESLDFFIQIGAARTSDLHSLTTQHIAHILAHVNFPATDLEQFCFHKNKVLAALAAVTIIQNPQSTPEHKYSALYQAVTILRTTVNTGMLYRTFVECSDGQDVIQTLNFFHQIEPLIALAEDYIDKGGNYKEANLDPIRNRINQINKTLRLDHIDLDINLANLDLSQFDSPYVKFIKWLKETLQINWLNSKL